MEARPRSLATRYNCIWIAIALDYVMCRPRSQSPRHQVMISTMFSRRWLPRQLTRPFCSSCQKAVLLSTLLVLGRRQRDLPPKPDKTPPIIDSTSTSGESVQHTPSLVVVLRGSRARAIICDSSLLVEPGRLLVTLGHCMGAVI
jgi:hypothetical protein